MHWTHVLAFSLGTVFGMILTACLKRMERSPEPAPKAPRFEPVDLDADFLWAERLN